ncbi:MAG: deoxyribodipyrimidine photo-lyase [Deltaproteobacteria bacterium]|nr:deoxyribodipyrimidine photo-lyase [Deltaproteobacteria bacterium]
MTEKWDGLEFDPRVTRRKSGVCAGDGECVVYWMQRAQRPVDNPALNIAIQAGNLLRKPVVVYFQLLPRSHHANLRHYEFMAQGLRDLGSALAKRRVGFVLWRYPKHGFLKFCEDVRPCLVISDENPMREAEATKAKTADALRAPFWSVDADVIVPSKLLGREHYAARTIRPKIHERLKEFLHPLTNPTAKVRWKNPPGLRSIVTDDQLLHRFPIDRSVGPVTGFAGGYREAERGLKNFLRHGLHGYAKDRNKPERQGTSRLSPYLHFGQISPHRIALAVAKADAPASDRQAFLEELIVRRELAVNFVRFNSSYDNFDSCEPWAVLTHRKHAADERNYLYDERQLANAETHDPLWNAAQKQMVLTGWMHGYLRMYWAKKILEWTPSPSQAFAVAVALNDRYELDGRDPNGYAGIAWAIVGKHDRAWGPERRVFGKIRYMSYESTSRKFDSKAYIEGIEALAKGRRD